LDPSSPWIMSCDFLNMILVQRVRLSYEDFFLKEQYEKVLLRKIIHNSFICSPLPHLIFCKRIFLSSKKMTSSKSPLSSLVLLCQKTLARSLSDVSSLRVLAVPRYQHLLSGILRHLFQDLVTNHQQKGIVYDKICSLLQVDKLIRCVIV
jgi:hypothetical protein